MLDERPIPMYLLGFPPGVQRQVYETVQKELESSRKLGLSLKITEESISFHLDILRELCNEQKINSLGPASSLTHYIAAIKTKQ